MVFKETYNNVKNTFSSLAEINDAELEAIENVSNQDDRKSKTNRHLFLISAASLTILVSPYIVVRIYNSLDIIVSYLLSKKGHYEKEYIDLANFSFGFGSIAILMYLFLFPSFKIFGKAFPAKSPLFSDINKRQPNYVFFSISGSYLVLGFVLYLAQLNDFKYSNEIISFLKYYLVLPLSILSIFILTAIIVLLFAPFIKHLDKYDHSSDNRIELSFILLKVLHKLKDYDKTYLIPKKDATEVVKNLQKASNLVRTFPDILNRQTLNTSLVQQFNQSANFIDQIIIDFQTTNELEKLKIKERLIDYLNIILQGNLFDLPKLEIETNDSTPTKKLKLYHYLLLAIYLTLPIIIVILINIFFKVTFSDYNQSLLKILYIIWAFVGVFSNPIILNSENKDLIRDIIKSWFGK